MSFLTSFYYVVFNVVSYVGCDVCVDILAPSPSTAQRGVLLHLSPTLIPLTFSKLAPFLSKMERPSLLKTVGDFLQRWRLIEILEEEERFLNCDD